MRDWDWELCLEGGRGLDVRVMRYDYAQRSFCSISSLAQYPPINWISFMSMSGPDHHLV